MLLPPSHSAAYRGTSLQSCVCAGNETTALSEQYLNRSERLRGQNSVGNLMWHWFFCGNVKMARVLHNLLLFVIRLALKIRVLGFWSLIYGYCALCTVVALLKLWWNIILRPTTTFQWEIRETPPACLNDTSLGTHCYVRIKVRRARAWSREVVGNSPVCACVWVRERGERKKNVVWGSLHAAEDVGQKKQALFLKKTSSVCWLFSVCVSSMGAERTAPPPHGSACQPVTENMTWYQHTSVTETCTDLRRVDIYKLVSCISRWPHNCYKHQQAPLDRPIFLDVEHSKCKISNQNARKFLQLFSQSKVKGGIKKKKPDLLILEWILFQSFWCWCCCPAYIFKF